MFDLLVSIHNHQRVNWEKFPIMGKYYHCAKQCFVKRYCKCGGNSTDAFKFIKRAEDLPKGKVAEDLISQEDLLKSEEILEYI